MTGTSASVRIIENARPNMMANASGPQSEDAPAKGSMPTTVVMVVRTIGRKRETAASMTASRGVRSPRNDNLWMDR